MFCQNCQTFGTPKVVMRGSTGVASFMRLLFPFNLFYSMWRSATKYKACRRCGGRELLPESEVDDDQLGMIIGGKDYVENKLRADDEEW